MPVRLGPMLKIIPSSSPPPRGRRDQLLLSLPHGRDGRETPVRAVEWVWERVGVRTIGFFKMGSSLPRLVALGGTCFCMSRTRRSASLRMNLSRIGLLTLACGIATICLTSAAEPTRNSDYDYDPPAAGSYSLPVIKSAADGALLDSNNKSVQLRDLTRGRITVSSFIYTRCAAPKACPYATGVLTQIHDLSVDDKTLAKSMRLVSLSFD